MNNINSIKSAYIPQTIFFLLLVIFFIVFISNSPKKIHLKSNGITLVVLGTIQDGGSPHIGCSKICCKELFEHPDNTRKVVSLGLIDHREQKKFLFEASPDMPSQLKFMNSFMDRKTEFPDGIFLTHAHIGHYTGLMYLGREAMNSTSIPVYVMPRMKKFLSENGPWSQLVSLKNISLQDISDNQRTLLGDSLIVVPMLVPHRDEYSEVVGYKIIGPRKTALFIPDIDKWNLWKNAILNEIKSVDYAFLDATFFDANEISNRLISEIPHPCIIESMSLFEPLSPKDRSKVYFIHFNHTNPVLNIHSAAYKRVIDAGFHIAKYKDTVEL